MRTSRRYSRGCVMVHFVLKTPIFRPSELLRIEGNCNHNCNQGGGSLWLSEQVRTDGVGGGAGECFGGVLIGREHGAAAPSEVVLYDAVLDSGFELERRGGVPGVVEACGGDACPGQDGLPVVVVALWVDATTCWGGEDGACGVSRWGTGPHRAGRGCVRALRL